MRSNRTLALVGFATAAGLAVIWIEGQNLRLNQKLTELNHEQQLLAEQHAGLRLQVSRLAAPASLMEVVSGAGLPLQEPKLPVVNERPSATPRYMQR